MPGFPGPPAPRVSAVVLAMTPATRLPHGDGTLIDRLNDQLAMLDVRDTQVVGRTATPTDPGGMRGVAEDLRGVAKAARDATGTLAVIPGDLVTHTEALAMLIEHPERSTAALVAPIKDGVEETVDPLCPPVRVEDGRVAAASSSFHRVPNANATFRGVLHIGQADLGGLARVAEELADHVEAGRLGPIEPTEVADLILVGLVRSGIRVRARDIGQLHCERVGGRAEAAIRRLAVVDETEARLDAALRPTGLVPTYLVDPWVRGLLRLILRLNLDFAPTTVTGFSFAMAFLAAVWYTDGGRRAMIFGGALLFLSIALDRLDGAIARYSRAFSPIGAWFDAVADRGREFVVCVGLAIGYGGEGREVWLLAVAVVILMAVRDAINHSHAGARADSARVGAAHLTVPRSLTVPLDDPRPPAPEEEPATERPSRRREPSPAAPRPKESPARRAAAVSLMMPPAERAFAVAVVAAVSDARTALITLLVLTGGATLGVAWIRAGKALAS